MLQRQHVCSSMLHWSTSPPVTSTCSPCIARVVSCYITYVDHRIVIALSLYICAVVRSTYHIVSSSVMWHISITLRCTLRVVSRSSVDLSKSSNIFMIAIEQCLRYSSILPNTRSSILLVVFCPRYMMRLACQTCWIT